MKQGMRKDMKLKLKPWLTKGIKSSMKRRDNDVVRYEVNVI